MNDARDEEVGTQGLPAKKITAKMMITSRVPITRTFRVTPGVEPARASVVVSTTEGSECLGSAIMLSSRNQRSSGQRADRSRVPESIQAAGTVAASKKSAWAIAALTVER
jgi:hypothetical protein